jgi:hypothetical protein
VDKKMRSKWLRALRSGKYKQGRNALLNKQDGYCCLGVLASVCGVPKQRLLEHSASTGGMHMPELDVLGCDTTNTLIEMNDSGKRFTTIANWIEKNL